MKKKDQEAIAKLYTEAWGDYDIDRDDDIHPGDFEENKNEINLKIQLQNIAGKIIQATNEIKNFMTTRPKEDTLMVCDHLKYYVEEYYNLKNSL